MCAAAHEATIAQTRTLDSLPKPPTPTRPTGPAAIASPSAAAPAIGYSVTKPAGVMRATRPVPISGNHRLPSDPAARSPGRTVSVAAEPVESDRPRTKSVAIQFLTPGVTALARKS